MLSAVAAAATSSSATRSLSPHRASQLAASLASAMSSSSMHAPAPHQSSGGSGLPPPPIPPRPSAAALLSLTTSAVTVATAEVVASAPPPPAATMASPPLPSRHVPSSLEPFTVDDAPALATTTTAPAPPPLPRLGTLRTLGSRMTRSLVTKTAPPTDPVPHAHLHHEPPPSSELDSAATTTSASPTATSPATARTTGFRAAARAWKVSASVVARRGVEAATRAAAAAAVSVTSSASQEPVVTSDASSADSVSTSSSSSPAINASTLSGATDVVVVQHPDGSRRGTPFHVRFGRFKVLRPENHRVAIVVNGRVLPYVLRVGSDGVATWWRDETGNLVVRAPSVARAGTDEDPVSPVVAAEPRGRVKGEPEGNGDARERSHSRGSRWAAALRSTTGRSRSGSGSLPPLDREAAAALTSVLAADSPDVPQPARSTGSPPTLAASVTGDAIPRTASPTHVSSDSSSDDAVQVPIPQTPADSLMTDVPLGPPAPAPAPISTAPLPARTLSGGSGGAESPSRRHRLLHKLPSTFSSGTSPRTSFEDSDAAPPVPRRSNSSSTTSSSTAENMLTLTPAELAAVPLHWGANDIQYVTGPNRRGGWDRVPARIWLWPATSTRVVVSDIDGTITRSDALGLILPAVFGMTYAHLGVAQLYAAIAAQGFAFLYLTSRGIGQAQATRSYLASVRQAAGEADTLTLPDGPVLTSPDGLLTALRREVAAQPNAQTPAEFKAHTLRQVSALFDSPSATPVFVAGFGNRETDAAAYAAAGIPPSHTFLVDPAGAVSVVAPGKWMSATGVPAADAAAAVREVDVYGPWSASASPTAASPAGPLTVAREPEQQPTTTTSYTALLDHVHDLFPALPTAAHAAIELVDMSPPVSRQK
ncbi:Lipin-3 [Blastocladiella emersonii ATCC 22665]|nr:Lipin-3 [Blastocladiella emersonii ATCC 22665]